MSERSVAQARASVMLYNNEKKTWEPSGGSQGVSRVHVFHHPLNNTYRIVGRKQADHSVVINCALARGLKYNEATPTFHQWRDQRQVYGLNFSSKDDADVFGQAVHMALDALKAAAHAPQQHDYQQIQNPAEQYRPQQQGDTSYTNGRGNENEDMLSQIRQGRQQELDFQDQLQRNKVGGGGQRGHYDVPTDVSNQMNSSVIHVTPSQPPAVPAAPPGPPAAPAAPPAPPTPAAPPAPPGPPAAPGGGPPAPPPPPPPLGSSTAGGSLADQIAAAKLKKAKNEPEPRSERAGSVSRAPLGGMDMMAEMQKKLKARRAKEEGGEQTIREDPKDRPVPRSPVSNPPPTANKTNFSMANKTPSNNSQSRNDRSNSRSDTGPISADQLEDFKAELLAEFRRELDQVKREILEAIRHS